MRLAFVQTLGVKSTMWVAALRTRLRQVEAEWVQRHCPARKLQA